MSQKSEIEWTDATWNPVRGCLKVSPGCKHCYAETFAERFRGVAGHPYEQGFDPRLVPSAISAPLHWRAAQTVFVNSMSDLFGEWVPDDFIAAVFGVMMLASWHSFQVLTKRSRRMAQWFAWLESEARRAMASGCPSFEEAVRTILLLRALKHLDANLPARARASAEAAGPWPLPNVWIGVSVEDRKYGVPRIDELRRVPAAVRFLSIEPLLEGLGGLDLSGIGWVICGGESGHDARPMHPDWARSIRDQCAGVKVPFFFKQWGAWFPEIDRGRDDPDWRRDYRIEDPSKKRILNLEGDHGFHGERVHLMTKLGKKRSGRLLDGRTHDEMPSGRVAPKAAPVHLPIAGTP